LGDVWVNIIPKVVKIEIGEENVKNAAISCEAHMAVGWQQPTQNQSGNAGKK